MRSRTVSLVILLVSSLLLVPAPATAEGDSLTLYFDWIDGPVGRADLIGICAPFITFNGDCLGPKAGAIMSPEMPAGPDAVDHGMPALGGTNPRTLYDANFLSTAPVPFDNADVEFHFYAVTIMGPVMDMGWTLSLYSRDGATDTLLESQSILLPSVGGVEEVRYTFEDVSSTGHLIAMIDGDDEVFDATHAIVYGSPDHPSGVTIHYPSTNGGGGGGNGGGNGGGGSATEEPIDPDSISDVFTTDSLVETENATQRDGVDDRFDNCPNTYNPSQLDFDRDGLGDACDLDVDGDDVADELDNCLMLKNDQGDIDGDGLGDACDPDMDDDGELNDDDLCPMIGLPQTDLDSDGVGDDCDGDMDGDGVANATDVCPRLATLDHADLDGDGLGDACDDDMDGDGILNAVDLCPRHADDGKDTDQDGLGDACDSDSDGDGIPDVAGVPVEGFLATEDQSVPSVGLVSVLALLGAVLVLRKRV